MSLRVQCEVFTNWFSKSSTFCNIIFGHCLKTAKAKTSDVFEKIVYESKRDAWEMGGPDTADLCAVDPDSAPSKAIVFQWQKQPPSLPSR